MAMQLSCDAGVNKVKVKPKILSSAKEAMILNHVSTEITSPIILRNILLYKETMNVTS